MRPTFHDGIAQGGVGGACAFGSHIAFGGETSHQIIAGGEHYPYGAAPAPIPRRSEDPRRRDREVDMRIDQARATGAVAQVDDLGAADA